MAVYNTGSDSANTAVRAFLTKVGEFYLDRSFNTGSGWGKNAWTKIRDEIFNSSCAYCEKKDRLTIEHLIMFNKAEYGLHHPGNVVPCCISCNKRTKLSNGLYATWPEHLQAICKKRGEITAYNNRLLRIQKHHHFGEFKYPDLCDKDRVTIRNMAIALYEKVKEEVNKSFRIYQESNSLFGRKTPQ